MKLIKSGNSPLNKQKRFYTQPAKTTEELDYAVVGKPCKVSLLEVASSNSQTTHIVVLKTEFMVDSLVLIHCQQPRDSLAYIKNTSVDVSVVQKSCWATYLHKQASLLTFEFEWSIIPAQTRE